MEQATLDRGRRLRRGMTRQQFLSAAMDDVLSVNDRIIPRLLKADPVERRLIDIEADLAKSSAAVLQRAMSRHR